MKRCPHCGAKNKDHFDYCIRCSAALDVAVKARRSPLSTVVSSAVLFLLAMAFIGAWQYLQPTEEERGPVQPPRPSGFTQRPDAPPSREFDIERTQTAARAGMIAYHDGEYEKAAGLFQQFVEGAPDNPFGHMYLGLSLYRIGQQDEAIEAMEQAFRMAPGNPGFGRYLVGMLMQKGDWTSAEDVVRRYLDFQPRDEGARVELVRLMRRQGGLEQALAESERLVAEAPENVDAVLELGTCLKDSGQLQRAGELFAKAVELRPDSAVANHALGVSRVLSGRLEHALGPLRKAVELDPGNGAYHLALAQAYENLNHIEESFAEYEAFLQHSPNDPRAEKIGRLLERARETWRHKEAEREKAARRGNGNVGEESL